LGVASALAHLHGRGLLHGDFYAHNLQCDAAGNSLLGDMGAASFLPGDKIQAEALQRLEVRAFGCLLEELLLHAEAGIDPLRRQTWTHLRDDCLQAGPRARPLMNEVVARLH
jgi:serine/threonine protein kinase